jgi:flagellar hook-basal body complex protein FliE
MRESYVPKLMLQADISQTRGVMGDNPLRMQSISDSPDVPSFTDVMTNLAKGVNDTVKAPDALMEDVIMGNGADIHDVVIAMSKAEVGLNITTQMTTKVLQAYEKIMSIQV